MAPDKKATYSYKEQIKTNAKTVVDDDDHTWNMIVDKKSVKTGSDKNNHFI